MVNIRFQDPSINSFGIQGVIGRVVSNQRSVWRKADLKLPARLCLNCTTGSPFTNLIISITKCKKLFESGSDYMANFIPGWNFSAANWAKISDQLLKQILWKANCRLHGEGFSPGRNSARAENPSPVCSNRARIFSWPNGPENLKKSHVIETEFQHGLKKEREHAHWLWFRTSVNFLTEICVLRPGWNWAFNHNNISAWWAEPNFSPGPQWLKNRQSKSNKNISE